jgi:hypothetical protein
MNQEDRERLVRIEVKLDAVIKRGDDHETRIRSVEKRSWWTAGAAGLLAVFAPQLKPFLGL